jgi:hypothetical protein
LHPKPVSRSATYRLLTINLSTAKALGREVFLQQRADEVIE